MQNFITNSEEETAALACRLATAAKAGDVHLLEGPVGAGKTTFARAFIQSLFGVETHVPSPTYTIVQRYETRERSLSHFDLYRLKSPSEVIETGWEDALESGIVLVEWPDRLGHFMPERYIKITIQPQSATERTITIDDRSHIS